MGWEEYKKKLGVKHNFAKFGCKEFWVKLRRLDSFPYGETRESKGVSPEGAEELLRDPKKAEEAREEIEGQLVDCILDWHITDPDIQDVKGVSDEDKVKSMPLPTKEDLTSLTKLPTEFIVAMFEWLRDDSDLAKKVPKGTGTSSGRR